MSYLNQMYGQNSGKTPVNSYTDPRTGTIYFDNLPFNNPQQGLLSSPEYDSNGDLVDPRLQQQFQDNFNPANYTPSTIGPAPVLAPKTEPEQADPNAPSTPILEVQPDVKPVADPAVPPPALSRYEMSFGEKMGRYGGNIMNAGAKGGMAQVGAMGTTVGEIAGIERKQNQQLEENEIARMAKLEKPSSAALEKQAEIKNMYDTQVKYDQAIQDFIKYGDTVTGPLDMTVQSAKDSQGFGDPEREAFRYRIKEIIISDTLLQTAKTSGAISDKEMALFRSGVPKMSQQEDVWIAWLKQRSIWLKQINQRISDGVRVGVNDEITLNGYTAPVAAPAPAAAPSALTQAQLDAMKTNTPK